MKSPTRSIVQVPNFFTPAEYTGKNEPAQLYLICGFRWGFVRPCIKQKINKARQFIRMSVRRQYHGGVIVEFQLDYQPA
jgi:hypothetical protein